MISEFVTEALDTKVVTYFVIDYINMIKKPGGWSQVKHYHLTFLALEKPTPN